MQLEWQQKSADFSFLLTGQMMIKLMLPLQERADSLQFCSGVNSETLTNKVEVNPLQDGSEFPFFFPILSFPNKDEADSVEFSSSLLMDSWKPFFCLVCLLACMALFSFENIFF